ncbi:hypothetical protein [Pontibacter ruber]|uniref:Uncharacterized protein n=1 Tax=Pontibacter ruber TaxID=1343895 RepID=A0ABW5CZS0_9BACT|nr:hypothetical protein [Pontibacter ruber]
MKQTRNILALLMLFIHLSSLAIISFLPGESAGVAFKKVCLREEARTEAVATAAGKYNVESLLLSVAEDAKAPAAETEIKLCSVKLYCTAASYAVAITTPLFRYQEPLYIQLAYTSLTSFTEPEPPKIS